MAANETQEREAFVLVFLFLPTNVICIKGVKLSVFTLVSSFHSSCGVIYGPFGHLPVAVCELYTYVLYEAGLNIIWCIL